MWPSCAHILKPLTDQSGLKKKAPIKWTDEMQKAFDKMRLLMAAHALAAYPNHNLSWRQHVGNVSKSHQIWVDMRVGANTKSTLTQEFCVGNCQQIVDTVVPTDTVIRTYCSTYVPQGVVAI
jgi:hypothetical protein